MTLNFIIYGFGITLLYYLGLLFYAKQRRKSEANHTDLVSNKPSNYSTDNDTMDNSLIGPSQTAILLNPTNSKNNSKEVKHIDTLTEKPIVKTRPSISSTGNIKNPPINNSMEASTKPIDEKLFKEILEDSLINKRNPSATSSAINNEDTIYQNINHSENATADQLRDQATITQPKPITDYTFENNENIPPISIDKRTKSISKQASGLEAKKKTDDKINSSETFEEDITEMIEEAESAAFLFSAYEESMIRTHSVTAPTLLQIIRHPPRELLEQVADLQEDQIISEDSINLAIAYAEHYSTKKSSTLLEQEEEQELKQSFSTQSSSNVEAN